VVATPIGNLGDLTPRAGEILSSVDVIAAEDTRHVGRLLTELGLRRPLLSLHEHNEARQAARILGLLVEQNNSVALVSDAGTPLISDPGYRLVAAARDAGVPVSPVPGCSATIAALSVAGLPTDCFLFEGFLPATAEARRRRLRELEPRAETLVFFEAIHRIAVMLADAATVLGDGRPAFVGREMTKLHETFYRGRLDEVAAAMAADPGASRGECTVVIGGCVAERSPALAELERVVAILASELPPARAAALAARITGGSRRDAYRIASGKPGD
jgi:16S rRNA (cytidine1402-2'-O)-methyltransferase